MGVDHALGCAPAGTTRGDVPVAIPLRDQRSGIHGAGHDRRGRCGLRTGVPTGVPELRCGGCGTDHDHRRGNGNRHRLSRRSPTHHPWWYPNRRTRRRGRRQGRRGTPRAGRWHRSGPGASIQRGIGDRPGGHPGRSRGQPPDPSEHRPGNGRRSGPRRRRAGGPPGRGPMVTQPSRSSGPPAD